MKALPTILPHAEIINIKLTTRKQQHYYLQTASILSPKSLIIKPK